MPALEGERGVRPAADSPRQDTMPHWVYPLGRKFASALVDPKFKLIIDWPYWNRRQVQGYCYYAEWQGRKFCLSQSRQSGPDTMAHIASIFRNGDAIDTRVGPFYCNRRGQVGLLAAAWNASQWIQIISPGTPGQPQDAFTELERTIRADRSFDPQPLDFGSLPAATDWRIQELEDILGNLQVRADFEW